MNLSKKSICIILIVLNIVSCKKDDPIIVSIDLSKGVFIVNEGNFTANNGDISFYNNINGEIRNNIYSNQNDGIALGDVIQSMCISDTHIFISVNNSRKVEVVDINTFKHETTITGLSYPRYIISGENRNVYLTNGFGDGKVYEINTNNFTISDSINVGSHPENLIYHSGKLFVCNGAWGHDSTITVINCETNSVIETKIIGDGTTDICSDSNGNIWILCQGKSIFNYTEETPSKLVCIDPDNNTVLYEKEIGLLHDGFYPIRIASNLENGDIFYIEKSGVYKFNISEPENHEWFIIGSYYGMEIDQSSGNIYVFYDNNFSGNGHMEIYSETGVKIDGPIEVGIGPNGASFK